MAACCSSCARSSSRALSTRIAFARFLICERSSWQVTTSPVGTCVIRTAESVVLTPCPPGPDERYTSTRRSFSSTRTSTSSASGSTATVTVEVWMRPHPHLHRHRRRAAGGRGRGRAGGGERSAGGRVPLVGSRRAGRQHHRLGGADHARPDGARRHLPGRALADQESRESDARAQGATARARAGRAAGGHGRRSQVAGRHRRAQRADPHLQLPRGPRDRSPDRAHPAPPAHDPRGRPRRDRRRADGGRASRAAAEGRVVRRAVDPDALIDARPSVQAALAVGADALRSAGVESAPVDAEWLLAGALRISHGALSAEPRRTLEAPEAGWYVAALRRRMKREPLQHILGSQPFRQVTVRVTADAMVPRPETELLAQWALDLLPRGPRPLVIDLGTGTGCIACAIASERPDAEVIALEASPRAAMLARENVAALGLSGRVSVEVSELFTALGTRRADVIV